MMCFEQSNFELKEYEADTTLFEKLYNCRRGFYSFSSDGSDQRGRSNGRHLTPPIESPENFVSERHFSDKSHRLPSNERTSRPRRPPQTPPEPSPPGN